jgi:hypothetical protein
MFGPVAARSRLGKDASVDTPETKYAKTVDGVHIAYQVRGDGPIHPGFSKTSAADRRMLGKARCLARPPRTPRAGWCLPLVGTQR